jgi:DNA-directed RNA polymerase subunit beta'
VLDVNNFDTLRIGLANADQIRMWSNGEVRKPETINYRTLKPEKDGLFCEKIFGPQKDWECYCGKYKRVRFRGIICEKCGVEVTRSKVRRERMGHIELAAPVTHIWYFKGVPSRLGYLLDITPKELEKVIYFAAYLVTSVDDERRHRDLPDLEARLQIEVEEMERARDLRIEERLQALELKLSEMEDEGAKPSELETIKNRAEREVREDRSRTDADVQRLVDVFHTFQSLRPKQLIENELIWREMEDRYAEYYTGGMGAEAIKDLLGRVDLEAEDTSLRETIQSSKGQKRARAIKRLKVAAAFLNGRNDPRGMVLDCVPVIPPDLRPMVQLDGGRFATSDLNDLYRRVINRNNRLKRLLDLGAPEIIVNNEKRMLQEAVDALFDNGRRGRAVTGPGNRPLKSLSDMLKGKQGRFRQNLLGKRVDYSGRSVIVVGPQLKLHQCGLPKQMAIELFKPFVMKRLVDLDIAQNIKMAKRMVERHRPQVWPVLEEVIQEHPVLLNRAPTLHRLGIQAFEPVLVDGKAIQIHPLVCTAFNADFDGDQMAVHLPLSAEAQAEARLLMLSANNILSPAYGKPIVTPTQDMVIGIYYLTEEVQGSKGEGRAFSSPDEAAMAYDQHDVDLHARVKVRWGAPAQNGDSGKKKGAAKAHNGRADLKETTIGRIFFNQALPPDHEFVDRAIRKGDLGKLIEGLADRFPKSVVAQTLDNIKDLGFRFATQGGLTISVEDVKTPPSKPEILDKYESRAEKVEQNHRNGVITDEERRQQLIEIWQEATGEIEKAMISTLGEEQFNPVDMMVGSGARGNVTQVKQIAGMRGLVANPRGDIIPRPIKSNFREGLSVLEYFISTHGARKGLSDTALRTADSGYLTRRLVDVAQEVIVREEDCGTDRGITVPVEDDPDERGLRVYARTLAEPVPAPTGRKPLYPTGHEITRQDADAIHEAGIETVRVRSVLTCEAKVGVCAKCYGWSLAMGGPVDLGEAAGIVAAQSIGEPGTQLTMRTFHTGGVAGEDITHGLPRVIELVEARTPKGKATIAAISGTVSIEEEETGGRTIVVTSDDGEDARYPVGRRARLRVGKGAKVSAGDSLTEGPKDPKEILEIQGIRAVQQYLVDEVQSVYRSQGVSIHDKHIELIVRQMLKKVVVQDAGDTEFLPGERVDARLFRDHNQEVVTDGGDPAEARPELMGITKASLATESWLSAASFQETTRVLTEAAIEGRSDPLLGLKENVIIGKLIPAGTGMTRYRAIKVNIPDAPDIQEYESFFMPDTEAEEGEMEATDAAAWLRSIGGEDEAAST